MLYGKEEKTLNILLDATSERQQILAHNLTNSNTQGFVRRDLDFFSVLKDANKENSNKSSTKIIEDASYEDMNSKASYEKELSEMLENHVKYILLTRINGDTYKKLSEAAQSGRAA